MKRTFDGNFILLGLLSFCVFVFYLFYINLSIDTIILFLSNKIFLGKWLAQGVFPWFNPHIFLGTPFAFDIGLGNLHPFNLFFLLPYPYSFAVWVGLTSLLFLTGFYLLFLTHTKTKLFALILTVLLYFSGSGLLRLSNPTIFLVIAHYGFFAFSLRNLEKGTTGSWIGALIVGFVMTISGHMQFVIYGYIFGFLYTILFSRITIKKVTIYFFILGITTLWYFVFSIPLIRDSTRLTQNKEYSLIGNNHVFHYIQLLLPYVFGYAQNGSKWGPGPLYTLVSPLLFVSLLTIALWKNNKRYFVLLGLIIVASLGLFNFPFLRGAGQVTIFLHLFGLLIIAEKEVQIFKIVMKYKPFKPVLMTTGVVLVVGIVFFTTPLISEVFFRAYSVIKNGQQNLFYDRQTVQAIGYLVASSLGQIFFAIVGFYYVAYIKKINYVFITFVVIEGLALVFLHSIFIPTSVVRQALNYKLIQNNSYRVQSSADLIPYFGIESYLGDAYFRPPFSKEKPVFDEKESSNLSYLQSLFSFMPTNWSTAIGINSVQGYGTFMIKDLADAFKKPSDDYRTEYAYIIERNPLFELKKQNISINSISSEHLTLNDPRWEKLGVRYFISDRPLKKYKLIENKNGRFIYENEWASPMYRVVMGDTMTAKRPIYQNPNEWHFDIGFTEKGSNFEMIMNPGGFVATINGKPVAVQKGTFLLRVPLTREGKLILRYSPVQHLKETIEAKL